MSSAMQFMILFTEALRIANGALQSGDANLTMEQRLATLESKSQVCEQRLSTLESKSQVCEQRLSTLESQSQASEQKYAAVLSNVLSKLSSNTDDIRAAESQLNSTFDQLRNELEEVKANWNSSDGKAQACLRKDVGFEAVQRVDQSFAGGRLSFNSILFNADGDYIPGVFTVPVSGTYLIWFTVVFTDIDQTDKDVSVTIEVNTKPVASSITPINVKSHQVPGVVRGIYPIAIRQNDKVSFRSNVNGHIKSSSNYGGLLLRSRTQ